MLGANFTAKSHFRMSPFSDVPLYLQFPNAVVLNELGRAKHRNARKRAQMIAKERQRKSAKERRRARKRRKRAQKSASAEKFANNLAGLKLPGLGTCDSLGPPESGNGEGIFRQPKVRISILASHKPPARTSINIRRWATNPPKLISTNVYSWPGPYAEMCWGLFSYKFRVAGDFLEDISGYFAPTKMLRPHRRRSSFTIFFCQPFLCVLRAFPRVFQSESSEPNPGMRKQGGK